MISNRSRGALTGSSSASTMARIIVEDSFQMARPSFANVFKIDDNVSLPVMTWSDNLSTIAGNVTDAIANLNSWCDILHGVFHMIVKPDSRVGLSSHAGTFRCRDVTSGGVAWKLRAHERVLGCTISGSGKQSLVLKDILDRLNRCFWSHAKVLLCRKCPLESRLKYWKRVCFACIDHALPSLRPCRNTAKQLEAYSNRVSRGW